MVAGIFGWLRQARVPDTPLVEALESVAQVCKAPYEVNFWANARFGPQTRVLLVPAPSSGGWQRHISKHDVAIGADSKRHHQRHQRHQHVLFPMTRLLGTVCSSRRCSRCFISGTLKLLHHPSQTACLHGSQHRLDSHFTHLTMGIEKSQLRTRRRSSPSAE
jgi:hypothetical protein